jgi:hypothetical protein
MECTHPTFVQRYTVEKSWRAFCGCNQWLSRLRNATECSSRSNGDSLLPSCRGQNVACVIISGTRHTFQTHSRRHEHQQHRRNSYSSEKEQSTHARWTVVAVQIPRDNASISPLRLKTTFSAPVFVLFSIRPMTLFISITVP